MARYEAPKEITGHPGVKKSQRPHKLAAPEFQHEVYLKEGWQFTAGRCAGRDQGLFESPEAFFLARPEIAAGL